MRPFILGSRPSLPVIRMEDHAHNGIRVNVLFFGFIGEDRNRRHPKWRDMVNFPEMGVFRAK
jgi:hypothetical protein